MQEIPNKSTGDQLTASEFNNLPDELENLIQDTGIGLSGADRHQSSKSVANYVASGDFYVDSGIADAYILSVIAPKKAPTELVNGYRARFTVVNSNTAASTIDVQGTGVKALKKYDGVRDLTGGDLVALSTVEIQYVLSLDVWELFSIESKEIREALALFPTVQGCRLVNNGASPTTHLDFEPGTFKDTISTNAYTLATTIVKSTVAWAEGNNLGGMASAVLPLTINTFYHCFLIAKANGTVDAGFDTALNATNLLSDAGPSGYVAYRRVGSIFVNGSLNIDPFIMLVQGNKHTSLWDIEKSFNIASVGTSASFHVVSVPVGLNIETILDIDQGSPSTGSNIFVYSPLLSDFMTNGAIMFGSQDSTSEITVITDLSSQVKVRGTIATSPSMDIRTAGWNEYF